MDETYFLKTFYRFCESRENCSVCELLNKKDNSCIADIDEYEYVKKTVQIVEQWAKDHPVKTRQSEFLKLFPNAMINESDGILCVYPCDVEGGKRIGCANGKGCNDCRREYWLTEVTDNGNVY